MRNIGLLGGTFDPVHNGHIELAMQSASKLALQGVLYIPAFHPPHKRIDQLTGFDHRVKMLELATAGNDSLGVSLVEKGMPKPTYTIDTLRHFLHNRDESSQYFFIIGMDAFLDIRSWKSYREVLTCMHIIVASRHGYKERQLAEILVAFGYVKEGNWWRASNNPFRIHHLNIDICDVSSSDIRKNIAAGRGKLLKGVVPDAVIEYILQNNLYI